MIGLTFGEIEPSKSTRITQGETDPQNSTNFPGISKVEEGEPSRGLALDSYFSDIDSDFGSGSLDL
ncbi:hypothetical protein AKJ63_01340 [candidate division MSBL1 archaeon SCGC-AAA259D18]|uniref:Uncharacterized protein n=1 Tax=candidate division MSBL1 archaeon SCGC-AAA259D18 TaxID=1698262 RepID=A0A133UBG4_9EURY|nr:hypothetical protein AKJ63_01340 [candidate division MSBL1 archaeon SCGC-AAA259D18]